MQSDLRSRVRARRVGPLAVILLLGFVLAPAPGCNGKWRSNQHSAERPVELDVRKPSPDSKAQDYQVDDDVSILGEDGTFETDARVLTITGKLVFAEATFAKSLPKKVWMPVDEGKNLHGDEPTASKGYKVRIGNGRSTSTAWFPPNRLFPAPWAGSAHIKVGDTVFERRSGDFAPEACVVADVPSDIHASVRVRCGKDNSQKSIERKEVFSSFTPATAATLSPGDIVYYDKMYWAMVVDKADGKIVIRQTGFAAKDTMVDAAKIQIAR